MKAIGIGTAASLGVGTVQADEHEEGEAGEGGDQAEGGADNQDGGRGYTPYGGNDTNTAPDVGGFDHVLGYLAEGIVDGPTEAPEEFQPDPTLIKWFQEGLMQRTPEEVRDDRQLCHDHYINHWGIDLDARAMGETWLVDAGTLVPPLGGGGAKAAWAKEGVGPDEFTGMLLSEFNEEYSDGAEGVTTENMYKTFVWIPDPDGYQTDAAIPDTPLMLEPKVGYSNYFKSGTGIPNNVDGEKGTTNLDPFTTNKVRDGGYWIFAIEDDDVPLGYLTSELTDYEAEYTEEERTSKIGTVLGGKPTFWYNTAADGEKRTGRGVKGGKEPEVEPPDKLDLDGVGPDSPIHDGLPEQGGFFWGDYNIYRGEQRDPLIIHYDSRLPTEFNPHSGIPRAFMCELQCAEFETDRNPYGLGRVHGSTYPAGTTIGNVNGHNYRENGAPDGMPASTIRNMLTFPPSVTRGRDSDVEGGHNVAPGLPENRFADSQADMPGFPEAFR
jgi:hypothetical protein